VLAKEVCAALGLARDPFSVREEADVYLTREMRRAAAVVQNALDMHGMVALVGPSGCGKTITFKWAISKARRSERYRVCTPRFRDTSNLTVSHIQEALVRDLGDGRPARSRESQARQIEAVLRALADQGTAPVLYINEAQGLHHETLRCLKRLWEHEYEYMPMLAVVLVGQTGGRDDLLRKLGSPDLAELSRRVESISLGGLGKELSAYVAHKLERAGGRKDLVAPGALRAIARASDLPLDVDLLLERAFRLAVELGEKHVSEDIVGELVGSVPDAAAPERVSAVA